MSHSLKHHAIVDRTEADKVIVRVEQQSACAGCHAKGICGESGKERIFEIRTPYASEYKEGDKVTVALLRKSMGITSILWSYVFPLIVLLSTLFICKALNIADGPASLTSIAAIVLYYGVLYLIRKRFERKIEFTIFKEF